MHRFPTALGVVFILQAVLNHLELQLADGADNLAVVELIDEQLGHTLVHQLIDALLKLLRLHRVVVLDVFEQFRREGRQSPEMQLFTFCQRIANLKHAARIRQANDITRPCLIDG